MGELSRRSDIADPPVQPTPAPKTDRPANADVQAQLAHLTGRKPRPTDRATDVGHQPNAKPDTGRANDARNAPETTAELDEAQAEIAALRSRLEERDADLDAAKARIAELEGQLDTAKSEFADKIGSLESRLEAHLSRQDQRIAELESQRTGRPGDIEPGPGAPDSPGDTGASRIRDREIAADAQRTDKSESKWSRFAPSDAALGFMSSNVGVALTEASLHMPPGPAHAATLSGGLFGATVAGVAWIRNWRSSRNADRPQG